MSFLYKGVNLDTILDSGSSSASFVGLSTNTILYDKNKPLPVSYQINGTDISNTIRAAYKTYGSSATAVVPASAKHFRFYGIGGGGGGGGSGGKALDTYYKYAYVYGGDGGNGANGGYVAVDKTAIVGTFNVVIGAAGAQGNVGNSNQNNNPTTGGNGNAGGAGGATYYVLNGTAGPQAAGGAPGQPGLGGTANDGANDLYVKVANTPNTAANTSTLASDWEPISGYGGGLGYGGAGGYWGGEPNMAYGNNGSAGSSGYARIIWLFDL